MSEQSAAAPAVDRFDVRMRNRSIVKRVIGWATTLVLANSQGAGPTVPAWSQDAEIVDRSTGKVLGDVRNTTGSPADLAGQDRADVSAMSADEFATRWLPG